MDKVLVPYLTADDERERQQHLDELLTRHCLQHLLIEWLQQSHQCARCHSIAGDITAASSSALPARVNKWPRLAIPDCKAKDCRLFLLMVCILISFCR